MPAQTDTKLSQLSLRILSEISDGEWHDQDEVVDAVMYTIPPGEAYRHAERVSTAKNDSRSAEEKIAAGQRQKTVAQINGLIQNHRVEREGFGRGVPKQIRVRQEAKYVYVLRDENGNLSVETYNPDGIIIHVIDAFAESDDLDEDLRTTRDIMESIPYKTPGKDHVKAVCKQLINRLNVRKTFRKATEQLENAS